MQIIRSKRKSICIQVNREGEVIVRAPLRMAKRDIDAFVQSHHDWIESHVAKMQSMPKPETMTENEIKELSKKARAYIPQRVAHFAPIVGVTYDRIAIRSQHTKWGSCSSKGNLNFNCLLMLTPTEVIDSVVVHELCHRVHMNHSSAFYELVRRVYPEYDRWNSWLRQHGGEIMAKNPRD